MPGELMHGGRLRQAAQRYAIPVGRWLDLSTGINPHGWPVPVLTPEGWRRLPEESDGLEEAAADFYGCRALLPVAGSKQRFSYSRYYVVAPVSHCWLPPMQSIAVPGRRRAT